MFETLASFENSKPGNTDDPGMRPVNRISKITSTSGSLANFDGSLKVVITIQVAI
jgi:hypothetical protein